MTLMPIAFVLYKNKQTAIEKMGSVIPLDFINLYGCFSNPLIHLYIFNCVIMNAAFLNVDFYIIDSRGWKGVYC